MVLTIVLVIPVADAQLIVGDKASHKRLEITINDDRTAHVLHEIQSSQSPVTMISVDGEYENVTMTDAQGSPTTHPISQHDNGFGVTIFSAQKNTIVEYDLINATTKIGAYETWDYNYLETTVFMMPDDVNRVYINEGPVDLVDVKKIRCHGCSALLEFTLSEMTHRYDVESDGTSHNMEITTVASPRSVGFDADAHALSLDLDVDDHAFVNITIPHQLLKAPYEAYYGDERLKLTVDSQNDTHSDIRVRMPEMGILDIFGNLDIKDAYGDTQTPANNLDDIVVISVVIIAVGAAGIIASLFIWKRRRSQT